MVALSWADRLARLPLPEEQIIEGLARAIYMTHWRQPSPIWENASDGSRNWSRAQAREALGYLKALKRPAK
jgi:hypothetical protein